MSFRLVLRLWQIIMSFCIVLLVGCQTEVVEVSDVTETAVSTSAPIITPTQTPLPSATFTLEPTITAMPTTLPSATPTQTPEPQSQWVYAVVVPFNTLQDGVTWVEVQNNWQQGGDLGELVLTEETAVSLQPLLAEPISYTVTPAEQLVETVWSRPLAWSIVPFHELDMRLKVLRVDGVAPIDRDFDMATYPLQITVNTAESNYDRNKITFISMSGPTGFARAVGDRLERKGMDYVAGYLGDLFAEMDIAHLNHEISFNPDCPDSEVEPYGDTKFCTPARYIEFMERLSIDVNEMTGNHLNDWGEQYVQYTFDLFDERGIGYFGGGRDLEEAREPLLMEHNGNKIAFVGCNPVGPPYVWADEGYGGALDCEDYSYITSLISDLNEQGYTIIATIQFLEHYGYDVPWQQRDAFRLLAGAGATAVSGSQGHHPQGFDFYEGAFIHYGIGNTFADQMFSLGVRQDFIDIYLVYDGQLINVDLWTGMIEDYCCARPMTQEEREALLTAVFETSLWEIPAP